MQYDPKDASNLIEAGWYDATIAQVIDSDKDGAPLTSRKSGEPMEKVVYEVYTADGTRKLTDYYTAKTGVWRYKKLAVALGCEAEFDSQVFNAADHIGDSLKLEIVVRPAKDQYPESNGIQEFAAVPKRTATTTTQSSTPHRIARAQPKATQAEVDNDPPF